MSIDRDGPALPDPDDGARLGELAADPWRPSDDERRIWAGIAPLYCPTEEA